MTGLSDLPEPDNAARAHSDEVVRHLTACIAAGDGWLSFADWMHEVLYAPGLGYYSAGTTKLGADGDFITAPEISDLYSLCLAGQMSASLNAMGGGDVLELGAGSGRMAAAMLPRLVSDVHNFGRYLILEPSADLRERQQQHLAGLEGDLASRVEWLDAPPAGGLDGVIVANEVLDALPVERIRYRDGQWHQHGVSVQAQGFKDHWRPASAELSGLLQRHLEPLAVGWPHDYETEFCARLEPWLAEVAGWLNRGAILFADYGLPRREYYLSERTRGTLLAYYRHRALSDYYRYPGLQDLTAWVDFTAVAEAASSAGLSVAGYATQAAFLLGAGLTEELEAAHTGDAAADAELAAAARTLLLPGGMGETFKLMFLVRGDLAAPPAFELQDLRHTL